MEEFADFSAVLSALSGWELSSGLVLRLVTFNRYLLCRYIFCVVPSGSPGKHPIRLAWLQAFYPGFV